MTNAALVIPLCVAGLVGSYSSFLVGRDAGHADGRFQANSKTAMTVMVLEAGLTHARAAASVCFAGAAAVHEGVAPDGGEPIGSTRLAVTVSHPTSIEVACASDRWVAWVEPLEPAFFNAKGPSKCAVFAGNPKATVILSMRPELP